MFKVLGCKPNITSKCILECSLAAEDTSTKTDNGEDSLNTCPAISIALFRLLVPHYQQPGTGGIIGKINFSVIIDLQAYVMKNIKYNK